MNIKAYLVGGAVRDQLLGRPVNDRDYVVVNSNASELLAQGFEQVGMGFPVFLHPWTGEEYALARREKKVGAGYTGFEFETGLDVTLVEDLERRDLTINSMALDDDGSLIDPFGGEHDLAQGILRHTSPAFAEDPLRVVRLARFFARYDTFTVASETMSLCEQMVEQGDLNELPDERFWRELKKAFEDHTPSRFFELLYSIGALSKITFFRKLFGVEITGRELTRILRVANGVSYLPKEDRVDMFAALMAPKDAKNLFDTFRAGRIYGLLWALDAIEDHEPYTVQQLVTTLQKARVWSEGDVARDVCTALKVLEDANIDTKFTSAEIANAVLAGGTVTSEPFQHLQGKAIGEAMFAERVKRVESILKM